MFLLHRNLAVLAGCAAKEGKRFAQHAIHIKQLPPNDAPGELYRAEVTDGAIAAVVVGSAGVAAEYPEVPALVTAPNGATEALIPAKAFADACKNAPKRDIKPILSHVACVLSPDQATLVSTNLETVNVATPRLIDGRFPSIDNVIPKKQPAVTFRVNPDLLIKVLQAAAAFRKEGEEAVTVEIRKNEQPIVILADNGEQRFTGLVSVFASPANAVKP